MIIKSSRIPTRRTAAISRYLAAECDTETVSWLRGERDSIGLMGLAARTAGKVYGVRHMVIAPEIAMDDTELDQILAAIQTEYSLSELSLGQACLVEHHKPRAGQGRGAPHFHLAVPEFDLETERVMDSRFTRLRDEKLARLLELQLGHPSRVGRFNPEVYTALAQEQPDLDLAPFERALRAAAADMYGSPEAWRQVRARAAFTTRQHRQHQRRLERAARRTGFDTRAGSLPSVRAQIRSWAQGMSAEELAATMQTAGYRFRRAGHGEAWIVSGAGVDLGLFHRLAGIPKEASREMAAASQAPERIAPVGADAPGLM